MLQQTRVDTVVPYYERFLARFPQPAMLARADPDAVRAAWSGLGYYRRAALLHRAAQVVVEEHGGQLPDDPAALAKLPGFGPYTVGAVASFAFDRPVPALDGNVKRVLARIHGISGDLDRQPARPELNRVAERRVAGPRPGRTNESLMELGATLCSPRKPTCAICPVRPSCVAFREGTTELIPPPKRKAPPKREQYVAIVAWTEAGQILLEQRGPGIFEGLWCVPMEPGDELESAAAHVGPRAHPQTPWEERGSVEHVLTHRRLSIRVFAAPATPGAADGGWVAPEDLGARGVPTLTNKLLRAALPAELQARMRWRGRRSG